MADTPSPRVFVSHSSADKERFVLQFAERLRANGIDAWIDRWEMAPGDSLVKRIFEEGIGRADAVIVVISRASLESRWVAEELDAAVVRRITTESLLIPIVIDGIDLDELPAAIRHLVLEFLAKPDDFEVVLDRVTRSVFGVLQRPPLGDPPTYTSQPAVASLQGMDRLDSVILHRIGEEAVRDNGTMFRTQDFVDQAVAALDGTEKQIVESLHVLDTHGLIELHRTMPQGIPGMSAFTFTIAGIDTYLRAYQPDEFSAIQHDVVARIIEWPDQEPTTEAALSAKVRAARLIVDHILTLLEQHGYLTMSSRTMGGHLHGRSFLNVSPALRRLAHG